MSCSVPWSITVRMVRRGDDFLVTHRHDTLAEMRAAEITQRFFLMRQGGQLGAAS